MTSAMLAQGVAALRAGDFSTAERILLTIVERNAAAHNAWHLLSVVAVRAGLPDIGVVRAQRAVELDRRNADYLNSLGIAHTENEELEPAEQALRRALKLRPTFAEAHYNLGKVLRKQGRLAESLQEYERAHALEPRAVPVQLGLAMVHRLSGRPERALEVLRAGLRDGAPDDDDVIPYLAECIADVEGLEASLAWLRGLLARCPDRAQTHRVLGVLLLSLGRCRDGWEHYLWRVHLDSERMRVRPRLLPTRLDGRRVYLRAEEGIGDILFYLRFAPELLQRGAQVALECPPRMAKLAPLLADRISIDTGAPSDLAIWIADLPALLQTDSIPPPFSLRADEAQKARARERLALLGPGPYLGLTWRAGTNMRRARELGAPSIGVRLVYKEVPAELLGQMVHGWPGTLVSLQRNLQPGELQALGAAAGARVHDLAAMTEDLRETLAVLALLDEHVAVINTNMHLLAGMGLRARALVPRPVDWRWTHGAAETPWFPGFSVYHQPASLDWSAPLSRLRKDLFRDQV